MKADNLSNSESITENTEKTAPSLESMRVAKPVKNAKIFAGVTFISRILGLFRDATAAAFFGINMIWDVFVIAFILPNLFRRLFGEGSLSAALIPAYSEKKEKEGPDAANKLFSATLTFTILIMSAITLLIIIIIICIPTDALANLLNSSDKIEKAELLKILIPILIPFLILICTSAIFNGILNVHGRFALPAAVPVFLNIFWIAALFVGAYFLKLDDRDLVIFMCIGIISGVLFAIILQIILLRKSKVFFSINFKLRDSGAIEVFRKMLPMLLGLGILQLNILIDNLIAEIFVDGSGAVSSLYYGNRLMQFPLALIGVALGVAVFPLLSKLAAKNDIEGLSANASRIFSVSLFLSIPAATGLILLNEEIVKILFMRKEFDIVAVQRTSNIVLFYACGLFATILIQLVTRVFYAVKDTKTPVKIAVYVVFLNIILNLILVHTPMKEAGLALATSISAVVNVVFLFIVLRKRLKINFDFIYGLFRTIAITAVMGSLLIIYLHLTKDLLQPGFISLLIQVIGGILISSIIYAVLSFYFNRTELKNILRN